MRAMNFSAAVVSAFAVSAAAFAQNAIEWKVSEGGNGHFYRLRYVPGGLTFDQAQAEARSIGGHLATITSSEENVWVKARVVLPNPTSTIWGPGFGGRKVNGVWTWVTGEPWSFTAWGGSEPTGDGPVLEYWRYDTQLWWNDRADGPADKWLYEWDADCNGDGIVDYGQILAGDLTDSDGDWIPDCCVYSTNCPAVVSTNGGFEAGTPLNACTSETVTAGNSLGTGWMVSAGVVQRVRASSACATQGTPKFGEFFVDLLAAGEIRQTIATVPGRSYRLNFWLSGDCAGEPVTKRILASLGEASQTFDHACSGTGAQGWRNCSVDFIANAALTTMSFKCVAGSAANGPLVDGVRVEDISISCPGDVDGDGQVTSGDIGLVLLNFGPCQ